MNVRASISKSNISRFRGSFLSNNASLYFKQAKYFAFVFTKLLLMHSYVFYTFSNSSAKVVLYCSVRLASGRLVNATFRIFIVSSSENTISNSHANKFKAVHTFVFFMWTWKLCLIRVITKLVCWDVDVYYPMLRSYWAVFVAFYFLFVFAITLFNIIYKGNNKNVWIFLLAN